MRRIGSIKIWQSLEPPHPHQDLRPVRRLLSDRVRTRVSRVEAAPSREAYDVPTIFLQPRAHEASAPIPQTVDLRCALRRPAAFRRTRPEAAIEALYAIGRRRRDRRWT